jgi:hypothetical protein
MAIVVIICLFVLGAGKQAAPSNPVPPAGAWLQTDLKWQSAPKTINPRLRTSTAAILYFGEDHTFALMYCVVNQVPGKYTVISHGDGLALYRGQWTADRKGIAIWYQFVPMSARQWPEASIVGQGIQHASIHRSRGQLSFANMKFAREPQLDDSAREAMPGTSDLVEQEPVR